MIKLATIVGLLTLCVICAAVAQESSERASDEASLLATDAQQLAAVAAADVTAIARVSHANLRVHAPNTRILTRDDFLRVVSSGQIRSEVAERIPESVTITGDVGVVMGREVTIVAAASEQAQRHGSTRVSRRYTNVYLRQDGAWLLLARHANIVAP